MINHKTYQKVTEISIKEIINRENIISACIDLM